MGKGQELYKHAKERIPGGTQLLSKRPEMFLPDQWPAYYSKAKGCEIWDLDGNHYYDFTHNGVGSCLLGYADPDVERAVIRAIQDGSMCSLNAPEEVELADLLCELHPWADMVRYARTGGEAMAISVRIARAHTRREEVWICGYHGWHDWYLAANLNNDHALDGHLLSGLNPAGVPHGLTGTVTAFHYNQSFTENDEERQAFIKIYRGKIAAIIMEPIRNHYPDPGFLEGVREIANEIGAVLIFDEISSGFRLTCGGAHLLFGVEPDVAVFSKAMSNGYPMAAIIGKAEVMSAAESTFISSTNWTERIGPTAALATIKKMGGGLPWSTSPSPDILAVGERVQAFWMGAAQRAGLEIEVSGIPQLAHFSIKGDESRAAMTLFTQLMLERGFLAAGSFYPTAAHGPARYDIRLGEHGDQAVSAYFDAVKETFVLLENTIQCGTIESQLKGPIAHAGFKRLN